MKEGGIFSVPDLQLILPPKIGVSESPSKSTPVMIVNMRRVEKAKLPSDPQTHSKSETEQSLPDSITFLQTTETVNVEPPLDGITILSRIHAGMSNASGVNSRSVRSEFVVFHNRCFCYFF